MFKPLNRSDVTDSLDVNSAVTTDYVGGSPLAIGSGGIHGTLVDAGYAGPAMNRRAVDIANGKAAVAVGPIKGEIWQGQGGDVDTDDDNFCPFDITVAWEIGDELYIRSMATYAVWSSVNYDGGVSHGFVTVAPASATGKMQAWFLERR